METPNPGTTSYIGEDSLDEFDEYAKHKRSDAQGRAIPFILVVLIIAGGGLALYEFILNEGTTRGGEEEVQEASPTTTTGAPGTGEQASTLSTPAPTGTIAPPTTPPRVEEEPPDQTGESPGQLEEPQTTVPEPTTTPTQSPSTIVAPAPAEESGAPPGTTTTAATTTTPVPASTETSTLKEPSTPRDGATGETGGEEEGGAPAEPLTPLPEPSLVEVSLMEACNAMERTIVDENAVACALYQSSELAGLALAMEQGSPMETLVSVSKWVRDNIEYSDAEYGLEQYVTTPTELLVSRKGDSEDWSLLELAILAASESVEKPVFAEVHLEGGLVHYSAGAIVSGALLLVEPEPLPYPRELSTDYYGMWLDSGYRIEYVKVYAPTHRPGVLEVYNITGGWNASLPHAPGALELQGARDAALESLLEWGFYTDCPPYVGGVAASMAEALPQGEPVLLLPYTNLTLPLDWYVTHDYEWVKERVRALIKVAAEWLRPTLQEMAGGPAKCVYTHVEVDEALVLTPVYRPNAFPETRETLGRSLIIYFIAAPRIHISVGTNVSNETLVIAVEGDYRPGVIDVLVVRGADRKAAIVAQGWAYQGLENVEASRWEFNGTHTLIEVPLESLSTILEAGASYGLLIEMGDLPVYLGLLPLESS